MKRLLMAIALGASLLIVAGLLQVLRANGHAVRVKDRPILHPKSNEEAINSPSLSNIEMTTKRLAVFKKILRHSPLQILVFYSTPNDEAVIEEARMAGKKLGIKLIERRVETVTQLKTELHHIKNGAVNGILHIPDNWIDGHLDLIFHEAREKKIPTMTFAETYAAQGALAAYNMRGSNTKAARYYLILNLETARQIGMTFPAQALKRADEIIDRDSKTGDGYDP
jgi:ABC-type uncharacterized transport system substrate-binding protein